MTDSNAPKRRRWLQFSIRSMLLLMVVSGLGFGWLQWKLKQAEKQREAVAWVEEMGRNGWV